MTVLLSRTLYNCYTGDMQEHTSTKKSLEDQLNKAKLELEQTKR